MKASLGLARFSYLACASGECAPPTSGRPRLEMENEIRKGPVELGEHR